MADKYTGHLPVPVSSHDIEEVDLSHLETGLEHKVYDGDDALKILHTHFEPYTAVEERKVLRKIDRRMVLLMLIVNGIQFIDKQASFVLAQNISVPDSSRLYPPQPHTGSSPKQISLGKNTAC